MRERFEHLTPAQVALVLGAIALAIVAAIYVPEEKWDKIPWEVVAALLASGGAMGGALLVRPRPHRLDRVEPPTVVEGHSSAPDPVRIATLPSRRDGSASVELLCDLVGLVACLASAVWLAARAGL